MAQENYTLFLYPSIHKLYYGRGNVRDVRMKPIWGLFWAKELKLLKIIHVKC
jgi:hypothetical protein